jgi:phospholipid/cholesterol/gamma-HCH transport system permease protein
MERTPQRDQRTDPQSTGPDAGARDEAEFAILREDPQSLQVKLSGRLDVHTTAKVWQKAADSVRSGHAQRITVDASGVSYCDGAGAGLLTYLAFLGRKGGGQVQIQGLSGPWQDLIQPDPNEAPPVFAVEPRGNPIEVLGRKAVDLGRDLYAQVAFVGRVCLCSFSLWRQPRRFRWKDFLYVTELGGVNAAGVVAMLGFLFGLIMAFSSAMPLRRFGVEIYVSDLVAIALVRVLGPFLTAVILAGRTGAAYAAEIGTMKINNELDALEVMAIDPVTFLVVPRVLALTLMTPLLATVTNLVGLAGSAMVILSLGYPLATYWAHVSDILSATDVGVGLVKALVFGGLVGIIGCLRGLQTQTGPGAVGQATTRAVVSSLVALVAAEGVFAVLLYVLDI